MPKKNIKMRIPKDSHPYNNNKVLRTSPINFQWPSAGDASAVGPKLDSFQIGTHAQHNTTTTTNRYKITHRGTTGQRNQPTDRRTNSQRNRQRHRPRQFN